MSLQNVEIVHGLYAQPGGFRPAPAYPVVPDAEFALTAVYPDGV